MNRAVQPKQPRTDRPTHERAKQTLLTAIARQPAPGLATTRVALHLLNRLDATATRPVSCTTLAIQLGLRPSSVHNAIRRLVRFGILIQGPRVAQHHSYRFAPPFGLDTADHDRDLSLADPPLRGRDRTTARASS